MMVAHLTQPKAPEAYTFCLAHEVLPVPNTAELVQLPLPDNTQCMFAFNESRELCPIAVTL